jgi:hypothetical protein
MLELGYFKEEPLAGYAVEETDVNAPTLHDYVFIVEDRPFYAHAQQVRCVDCNALHHQPVMLSVDLQSRSCVIKDIMRPAFEEVMKHVYSRKLHDIPQAL